MAKQHSSSRLAEALLGFAIFVASGLWAGAGATTIQGVRVQIEPLPGAISFNADRTEAADGQAITRDVMTTLSEPGVFGQASMDRFGNVALSGSLFGGGRLEVRAEAAFDEFINPFPVSTQVTSQVIVDGGSFRLLGPSGTKLTYSLVVTSSLAPSRFAPPTGVRYETGFVYEALPTSSGSGGFGSASLVFTGDPLNVRTPSMPVANERILDFTVLEIDLGIAQPGERFRVAYASIFETLVETGFPEIVSFDYRDPLSVIYGAPVFTPLDTGPPTALSAPAGIALAFLAAGSVFCFAMRR